jgi:hypothetical protein
MTSSLSASTRRYRLWLRRPQDRDAQFEFMRLMRATYPCVVQGSIMIEIYESVDPGKVA